MMTIPIQIKASENAPQVERGLSPASVPELAACDAHENFRSQQEADARASSPTPGPSRVLISDKDVAEMIGGSRATVWRRVKDGVLPEPIKFGGMTRWIQSEVEAAIAKQIAARDARARD